MLPNLSARSLRLTFWEALQSSSPTHLRGTPAPPALSGWYGRWVKHSRLGHWSPGEWSSRTGKIKWLERFLVLSCAHRKSTRKQDALPWETAHKGCKYDFYLQSDWISYSAFPDFPFSHLLKFTDLTLHYVSTIHGTRNIKMSKVHSVSSRNPVSSTIFLSHDPWLDENSLRGMHVLYSQIAYSFISQIFKISNVLNVMLGIQWLKKKKKWSLSPWKSIQ